MMIDDYALIADLYDHVTLYRTRPDVAFFVAAAVASGGPVLELGCGTGRVLVPTAQAGIDITGIDLSAGMLAVCRQRLEQEPPAVRSHVQLLQGDMRNFELRRRFPVVTLPFRPFQHLLGVDEQLACLGAIHRHLRDDGELILDVFNPSLEALVQDNLGQEVSEGSEFVTPDGRRVSRFFKIVARDRFRQVNQIELIYQVTHADGRTERLVHPFAMRYFFRYELEHLLARAGFRVEHVYADYDQSPLGTKDPGELIMVARKS